VEGTVLQEEACMDKQWFTSLRYWIGFDGKRRLEGSRHSLGWTVRGVMESSVECWSFSLDCPCPHKAQSPTE